MPSGEPLMQSRYPQVSVSLWKQNPNSECLVHMLYFCFNPQSPMNCPYLRLQGHICWIGSNLHSSAWHSQKLGCLRRHVKHPLSPLGAGGFIGMVLSRHSPPWLFVRISQRGFQHLTPRPSQEWSDQVLWGRSWHQHCYSSRGFQSVARLRTNV